MLRSRALLTRSRLPEFKEFCESLGWLEDEAVRRVRIFCMRHNEAKHPLIVYVRARPSEHVTVFGLSYKLALLFIKEKQNA